MKNIKKLFNKTSLNLKEVFDAAWKATACSDWVIFVLVVHPLPLISFCGNADCPPSQWHPSIHSSPAGCVKSGEPLKILNQSLLNYMDHVERAESCLNIYDHHFVTRLDDHIQQEMGQYNMILITHNTQDHHIVYIQFSLLFFLFTWLFLRNW